PRRHGRLDRGLAAALAAGRGAHDAPIRSAAAVLGGRADHPTRGRLIAMSGRADGAAADARPVITVLGANGLVRSAVVRQPAGGGSPCPVGPMEPRTTPGR